MLRMRLRAWILLGLFTVLAAPALVMSPPAPEVSAGPFLLAAQTKNAPTKKKRRRYRPRYTAPSYGNPTADDSEEGEDALARAVAARALGRYNGSAVVVEADSGRVLSVVNQKLAFSSGFKPCSTIKMAVGLAGLQEGLIDASTLIRVSRYQSMNLTEAMAYSNNPFFEVLGRRLGFEKVTAYARLLGFGELAGYLIEDEYPGAFPTEPPANGGVSRMSSFGEEIKVTPLQLAALMGAFANGGTLYYLQYPQTQEKQGDFRPRIKRHLPIQRWLAELRPGLEGAVLYGTARAGSRHQDAMLGKTGTCGEESAKLGWFASYGELPSGKRLAVVVLLRGGRVFNGGKAAEIAGEIYRGLAAKQEFGIAPEEHAAATESETN